MVTVLCSPSDPDEKISPFQSRIEEWECISDGRAVLSRKVWDNQRSTKHGKKSIPENPEIALFTSHFFDG